MKKERNKKCINEVKDRPSRRGKLRPAPAQAAAGATPGALTSVRPPPPAGSWTLAGLRETLPARLARRYRWQRGLDRQTPFHGASSPWAVTCPPGALQSPGDQGEEAGDGGRPSTAHPVILCHTEQAHTAETKPRSSIHPGRSHGSCVLREVQPKRGVAGEFVRRQTH